MNAGSTSADSALVTSTNGSWDITADTFIATAATPFSATVVGEYASIYNDGVSSGAVYVAQVTSVNSGGLSITLSTTIKYGTKPSAGATGKSCKTGGAWASLAVVTSIGSITVPQSTRTNVKAGTYANTTTGRSFAFTGTALLPVWWRGYNTTPGDLQTTPTLTPPRITFTTGLCTLAGAHQYFSGLDIVGANTGRQIAVTGSVITFDRVRGENTNAAAGSIVIQNNSSSTNVFMRSWFKATASATQVVQNTAAADWIGCTIVQGLSGLTTTTQQRLINCIFRAQVNHGFQAITSGAVQNIIGCTFRGQGGDGIRFDVLGVYATITNCLFAGITGYGINNNSGANTDIIRRLGCDFWSCTLGNENGLGDTPDYGDLLETSDPHVSATNLSLVSGALAIGGAQPGLFENEAYTSYGDVGAVQNSQGPIGQCVKVASIGTY